MLQKVALLYELFSGSGDYKVEVAIAEGGAEISVTSDAKKATYFAIKEPVVTGAGNDVYCPGKSVSLTLVDEGYAYTWYRHY